MAGKINYTRGPLTQYQTAIIDDPARFTITEASTKTGKTSCHIPWLFEKALAIEQAEGKSVWWVAPVYGQAEIAYRRMKNYITDRRFFKTNESKLILTLPTGAMVQFKSASNPDNLYGDDVFAAVFDEFTRAKESAWTALRSTLTATKGPCKFIGNVKGKKNWGYRLALKAKKGEDPAYSYHKITAYDAVAAGILDAEEVEQARRDLPDAVFKELYLAEPSDDGSNPFGSKHINACAVGMSRLPPVCFGIDLAKSSDWTVITGLDRFGQVCHFERFQRDWNATKNAILALPDIPTRIDSTGVGDPIVEDVQLVKSNIEGFVFSMPSKQRLLLGLAAALQRREVLLPESQGDKVLPADDPGHIINELESFEFIHTLTGVRYSAPTGFHDDCVYSLALAQSIHAEAAAQGVYIYA